MFLPCYNSQESVHGESWQDPLGLALGGSKSLLRAIVYGPSWKTKPCLPESPVLAKKRALRQGFPPFHPHTTSPSETVGQSSSVSVEGFAHGSPCPVDDITVRVMLNKSFDSCWFCLFLVLHQKSLQFICSAGGYILSSTS